MGRYVYGDFQYKFAFGEQSSNLGIVLEEIESELNGAIYVHRYISTQDSGEICKVSIDDIEGFIEYVEEVYLKDFKPKTDEDWHLWSTANKRFGEEWHDQNMMKLFIENVRENDLDFLSLEIEY